MAPLEELRAKHHNWNNVTVIKEGMNLIGLPAGRVREPISELDREDRKELVRILTNMGKASELEVHHVRQGGCGVQSAAHVEVVNENYET